MDQRGEEFRGSVQRSQTPRFNQTQASQMETTARDAARGRKHGWRYRRDDVRLTVTVSQEDLNDVWDGYDGDYSDWYGCGVDGCCVNSEWWAPTMPSHAFLKDGLVHKTEPFGVESYCGVSAIPYGIKVHSTDAAKELAALLAVHDCEVTCLQCIALDLCASWPSR